jgi:hypothetical protein
MFALSSLVKLALKTDDLRHRHALQREEDLVRLGIHTLDLALVVVIVRHLPASRWIILLLFVPAHVCVQLTKIITCLDTSRGMRNTMRR